MAAVTLATLRTRARQRADMANTAFVSDSELTTLVNESADELHDLLVSKLGDDYFTKVGAFSTVANVETVSLPVDFLKLLGVELQSGSDWVTLRRYMQTERNSFRSALVFPGNWPRYRLEAGLVRFLPAPAGVLNGRFIYIPSRTQLSADGDTFEGFNGWETYIVVDVARKCLEKEESDASHLVAEKAAVMARIEVAAANRDAGEPQKLVDTDGPRYGDDPLEVW
jgi:hypothetical protein